MSSKALVGVLALGLLTAWLLVTPATAQARDRDRDRDGQVTCGSVDGRYSRCQVNWGDAELVHQDSDARCVRGQTWGFDRGGIWVDRGCRGQFVAARGGWGGGGNRPGPGWGSSGGGRDINIQCGSANNRYQLCRVPIGRGTDVRLVNNDSDTRCREGDNWGVRDEGIWVDRGCRGRFVVTRRW